MTIRRNLAALAAVPLLFLAGCAGDSTSDLAGGEGSASPTPSPSATTDSGAGLTQETFFGAVTRAGLRAQTVHVAADMSGSGLQMTFEGDYKAGETLADSAMDLTMSAPMFGEDLRMVLVDQVMYLDLGQMTQGKFAKVDLGDTSTPIGQMMSQLAGSADLSASLKAMQRGIVSFEAAGQEQVDGVGTTRYRVEVDIQEVLEAQGMTDLPGAATAQLPKTVPYDIWVDGNDLIRRITLSLGGAMTMTANFTDWGEPVDISAPPRNQITKTDPFEGMAAG